MTVNRIPRVATSGAATAVQDEGSAVTQRDTLNFVGAGVSVSDDSGSSRTNITVAGGSGGGVPASARTVYAADPPSGSGLAAIAANGSTNDQAALQAALNYVDTTWGSGQVILPAGATVKCNSAITIPNGVQLRALEGSVLDFTALTGAAKAITISDTDRTPLVGVRLNGPGEGTSVTGIDWNGVGNTIENVAVYGFGIGVDLANENTYINKYVGGYISECGLGINLDLVAAGTTNSGENNQFYRMTLANCTKGMVVDTGGGSLTFLSCSIDYCNAFGDLKGGHTKFIGCHLESSFVTSGAYLFAPSGNPRMSFADCTFIMGSTGGEGLRWILNRGAGPFNYGFGRVSWSNCCAYFVDSTSAGRNVCSEELQFVNPAATTAVFQSPFVSKWGPITATVGVNDDDPQEAGITARIAIGQDGGGVTGQCTVTVTSAPADHLPIVINF